MHRDWEAQFSEWAQGPGKTEQHRCENAVGAIRSAINKSPHLKHRNTKVFVQGSYRNRVNTPKDSDVDVGVLLVDSTFYPEYPTGKSREDYGHVPATYHFPTFKDELGQALVDHFGGEPAVVRGNKAFKIRETTYHVDADVVPFFEHHFYDETRASRCGVSLQPDDGGPRIDNYPERLLDRWPRTPQHYENGVAKNEATNRVFKRTVRILKRLASEMVDARVIEAEAIPGFLIECLVRNATDDCFKHEKSVDVIRAVLYQIWASTKEDVGCATWTEVDGIKFLFHPTQKWTRVETNSFIRAAWNYIGVLE